MARLIDADDLIEIAEDILSRQNHKQVTIPSWLEKAINNTPTAYNVEKVAAELESKKSIIQIVDIETNQLINLISLDKAIDIVKRGGAE